jgi:hypothetical protein
MCMYMTNSVITMLDIDIAYVTQVLMCRKTFKLGLIGGL